MSWDNPSDTTWLDVYALLVYQLERTFTDPPESMEALGNCVDILVDLDSIGIAGDAQIELLIPMHKLYWYAKDEWSFTWQRFKMIELINKFTVRNYGPLRDFVNAINWDGGCVPYNWADACDQLGYDTSPWTVCS